MQNINAADGHALCTQYLSDLNALLARILAEERESIDRAASWMADQIADDRLIYIYGPGGHSGLAAQETFFRAGGLLHISAILDEGTLLSGGALRSMAVERTPGFGRLVIADQGLVADDLIILVNAYGINAAVIDAALEARRRGVRIIGLNSHEHARNSAADHPARHPSASNLQDLVDVAIDTKVAIGDALVAVPGVSERIAAASTFTNAFTLNCMIIQTVTNLAARGMTPPIWRSANSPGGDEANAAHIEYFRQRVRWL